MTKELNIERRRMLIAAATAIGGAGTAGAAIPFAATMLPSDKVKALGEDIEVDLAEIRPGELKIVEWRGKPVWILRRTPEMLQNIELTENRLRDPGSEDSNQPVQTRNKFRSIESEWLVLVGICTHLGCSPTYIPEHGVEAIGDWWKGGFFCPCHLSEYDLSGRVYKGRSPAPRNLDVPPYKFMSKNRIRVGNQSDNI